MKRSIFLTSVIAFLLITACNKNNHTELPAPEKPKDETPVITPTAAFSVVKTINGDGVKEGDDIRFENQSVNAVSYVWDFGYGVTSTEKSPVMQFGCGTTKVTLTVTAADGKTAVTQSDLLVYCNGKNANGNNKYGHAHTGITGN